ncbi:recombinase family protein [Escherichia coli]|nr:recombinase family protein [Escherichia coli]
MGHRAAIYCRVSTADQSCERQEFDLRAFAGCAGYDVVGIFKETGSGTKLDRAERKKVLALAQSRQIDAILVTELSRWGRSTLDLLNTLRELENWKVSVIAMNGMAFDLSSPYGRMLATFLSGIAEFERHCCKVSDEAAFCLIQRPYISKTLLTRRISPRGSP